jgi:hypothetical protein
MNKEKTNPLSSPELDFGGAATYEVVVQGQLSPEWSDRLGGLSIAGETSIGGHTRTTLKGNIRDQAELNGVLETIYGLHLSLIKVLRTEDDA